MVLQQLAVIDQMRGRDAINCIRVDDMFLLVLKEYEELPYKFDIIPPAIMSAGGCSFTNSSSGLAS